jgi:hypothetical protein
VCMRTAGGRTRNNTFDMYLRTAVLRHQQLDLDAVTSGPFEFPRGNAAYAYGSKFLQYIFDRFGDDKVAEMSHRASRDPIPFTINRAIDDTVGRSFDSLWGDWNRWLRDKYTTQEEAVERAGVREGRRLTFDTEGHIAPQYVGNELYWLANDGVSRQRLRAMPIGGNVADAHDVLVGDRWGGWWALSDGSVVYEQTQTYRRDYDFQDLFYWDRALDRTVRLTTGLRARDPAVSADGTQIAFTVNNASHSRLAVMPLAPIPAGTQPTIVYGGARFDQVYTPTWSPDGTRIAFSAWRKGGLRDILIVDVATRAVTEVTHDRAIEEDPEWTPDGARLYFSCDRSGIYNIYAYDLTTQKLWQVTNVIGGAFDPSVSADGKHLAYYGFDSDGFDAGGTDLYELALDPDKWTLARPYVDDRPDANDIPDDESPVSKPRKYRPLETLAPHNFTAQLDTQSSSLTVSTGGSDIAGLHAWSLGVTASKSTGQLNVGAAYGYGGSRLPVRVSIAHSIAEHNGYIVAQMPVPYRDETDSGTLSIGVPSRRSPSSSLNLSADFDVDYHRMLQAPPADALPDPNDPLPHGPLEDYLQTGIALRGSWSTTRGYTELLGPTEGGDVSASMRWDDPAIGAKYRALTMSWTARAYAKLPWGLTPVLSIRYAGGVRVGDVDRGDAFGLGGAPTQDFGSALISTARIGPTGYLRGYPSRVVAGDVVQLINLEYRQRLWQIEKGLSTLPLYVKRLHVAGLCDSGTAYDDDFAIGDVKTSLGAALRLDVVLGYYAPGTIEIGWAHGLAAKGTDETWALLTTTL